MSFATESASSSSISRRRALTGTLSLSSVLRLRKKGIYHGSMTSQLCVIALGDQADVPQAKIDEIKSRLAHLAYAAGVHPC